MQTFGKYRITETDTRDYGDGISTRRYIDLEKYGLAEIEDFTDRRVIRCGRFRAQLPNKADTGQPSLFDDALTEKLLSRCNRAAPTVRKAVTDAECRAARETATARACRPAHRAGVPAPDARCSRSCPGRRPR